MQHELRPLEKMNRYAQLRAADLAAFAVAFSKPENRAFRACPTCGEDRHQPSFNKEGFDFVTCRDCGTLYVNPVPSSALLSQYYDGFQSMAYFHEEILARTLERRRQIFSDRADMLAPFVRPGARLIEVGSSIGLFLEQALGRGWNITGVEINQALVERTRRELGANVVLGFIEHAELPQEIDMAVMWEVLEHLAEPVAVLRKLASVMRTGGRLALTLPNLDGIEFTACGSSHEMIEAPGHLNYFTPATIERLLQRTGFKVLALETPGVLDFTNVMQEIRRSSSGAGIGDKFLLRLIDSLPEADGQELDALVTRLLQKHKLSGNMFVVGEKI
jgi:2-polyprenyl-3-methyl-5-hydroxy-6-metoxy-1,4-benzoquinol methylase